MAFWNRKRSWRVDRLHVEGDLPWHDRLRSPRVLWQLGILTVLAIAALALVQGPRPPLPLRKGELATHAILARVDFEYVDQDVTADVRELTALLRVPGLYGPDARQAVALREGLLALVGEIAKADALAKVPEKSRADWAVTPDMFDGMRKALGEQGVNLPSVQEAVTKATAALADPLSLPIVREEDYQRSSARIEKIRDLRKKLPAGLSPDTVPILEEPTATLVVVLPDGDRPLALSSIIMLMQTDSIHRQIESLIQGPLEPIFGAAGVRSIAAAMARQIGVTLVYDQPKTENRRKDMRDAVQPVRILRKANTTLVEAGKEITEADLKILKQEQAERLNKLGWPRRTFAWVGAAAVLVILILLQAAYAATCQGNVARSVPRTLILAVLVLAVLGAAKVVAQAEGPGDAPAAFSALLLMTVGLIVTIAYHPAFALALTWSLALLVAIATRADLDWLVAAIAGTGVAVLALGQINNRSKLIKVGAAAGLVLVVTRVSLALWRLEYADTGPWNLYEAILGPPLLYFGAGLLAGIIMLAILPFIERAFGIVTNISLLELCDVNQPALKRLALEAPGTYTHSLLIGTLAEAAAEAVGANALLARVGAYFHDIGKANKPRYFVENCQEGEQAHSDLSPAMSRLIIMSHVKDGLEMADRLGLPPVIKQFVAEHHGTTLLEYFYREAARLAGETGNSPPVESDYRYPGPKPRSAETAIVMLADAAEGATRSLKDRSPTKIGGTVHDMVMKRLLDGQLDRVGLTLSQLHKVEETLTRTLLSVYHGRVPYPPEGEPAAAGEAAPGDAEAARPDEHREAPAGGPEAAGEPT